MRPSNTGNDDYSGYPPAAGKESSLQPSKPSRKGIENADSSADAATLHKAFEGSDCDEAKCYGVLAKRSIDQAAKICEAYQLIYSNSLLDRIESKTRLLGVNQRFMMSLAMDASSIDAYWILHSIKRLETDDTGLVEMFTSKSWEELRAASDAFKKNYRKDMATEIRVDTSGEYMKFLLALMHTKRTKTAEVDLDKHTSAIEIISKKFKGVSSDSDFIIEFMSSSSDKQIHALDQELRKTNNSLNSVLNQQFSGWFLTALTTYVSFCLNKNQTFAEKLRNAIVADDEQTVARILTTRGHIDLGSIFDEYERLYKKKFVEDLGTKSETVFWNAVRNFVSQ